MNDKFRGEIADILFPRVNGGSSFDAEDIWGRNALAFDGGIGELQTLALANENVAKLALVPAT